MERWKNKKTERQRLKDKRKNKGMKERKKKRDKQTMIEKENNRN